MDYISDVTHHNLSSCPPDTLLLRSPRWVINLQPSLSDGSPPSSPSRSSHLLPLVLRSCFLNTHFNTTQVAALSLVSLFQASSVCLSAFLKTAAVSILLSIAPLVSPPSSGDSKCIRIRGSLPVSWPSFRLGSSRVQLPRSQTHIRGQHFQKVFLWSLLLYTAEWKRVSTSISSQTSCRYRGRFFVVTEAGGSLSTRLNRELQPTGSETSTASEETSDHAPKNTDRLCNPVQVQPKPTNTRRLLTYLCWCLLL